MHVCDAYMPCKRNEALSAYMEIGGRKQPPAIPKTSTVKHKSCGFGPPTVPAVAASAATTCVVGPMDLRATHI